MVRTVPFRYITAIRDQVRTKRPMDEKTGAFTFIGYCWCGDDNVRIVFVL
jgi:hypothetical protein